MGNLIKKMDKFEPIYLGDMQRTSIFYKLVMFSCIIFVISLPFNGEELGWKFFNIDNIDRFELKITMITFSFLFCSWFLFNIKYPRKREKKEKIFYCLIILYAVAQFISLINSTIPIETIKQGVIVGSFLTMMVVVSESIIDENILIKILLSMGILSLLFGVVETIRFISLTSYHGRLGQDAGSIRGNSVYIAEIFLYSIGAVYYFIFRVIEKRYMVWLIYPLLLMWFCAIVLTLSKGVLLAVFIFFICLGARVKKLRKKMMFHLILYILVIAFVRYGGISILKGCLSLYAEQEVTAVKKMGAVKKMTAVKKIEAFKNIDAVTINRSKIFHPYGMVSVGLRMKSIIVSIENTKSKWMIGNGAGLSRKLLRKMADKCDKDNHSYWGLKAFLDTTTRGGGNTELFNAHNLFITEFFNVGLLGVIPLLCFIAFLVIEQAKQKKMALNFEQKLIDELLFATLIAMIFHRFTAALITIPFLWFTIGLNWGACRLRWGNNT